MPGRPTVKRPAKRRARRKPADEAKTQLRRHVVDAAYLQKPAHLRTREERSDAGKALRVTCPRESQAGFNPTRSAPTRSNADRVQRGRVERLVPIRYGRMLASPFAFFRGAAAIMAADLARRRPPASGSRPAVTAI